MNIGSFRKNIDFNAATSIDLIMPSFFASTIFNNNQEITTVRNIENILSSLFVQYLENKLSMIIY
jgi:hypothetical protein